ncbi:hypothetical protein [Salipaludibacillus aurantiacus]|uniref:Uncharacterized protein n=1 Tax=Salipaludibacillus aurantiacus TaxID=1601833 RepID=A0A1H9Q2C4_9BACI|nr:hypothetical protein [Salipaludibacillus aurantiacus]SER54235.1 hypothetical protein SAMN05518684_1023 [Salipaludibacillus aurantiacus]
MISENEVIITVHNLDEGWGVQYDFNQYNMTYLPRIGESVVVPIPQEDKEYYIAIITDINYKFDWHEGELVQKAIYLEANIYGNETA